MIRVKVPAISLAAALVAMLSIVPAHAALFKTFVAYNGNDANNCDLTTPCATIGHALTQTVSGGILTCLDGKDYTQTVTITSSVTVDCGTTTAGAGPFIINGAGITVFIKHAYIFVNGTPGVDIKNAKQVYVDNVDLNFMTQGILVETAGDVHLSVADSVIRNNTQQGIIVRPTGGTATVALNRVLIDSNNIVGVYADGAGGGAVSMSIADCVIVNNVGNGVLALGGPGAAYADITRSTISNNTTHGLNASGNGANTRISVGSSLLAQNGDATVVSGGGIVASLGNNQVTGAEGSGFTSFAPQSPAVANSGH